MEDGYSMFDYNININDVIQLMVKPILSESNSNILTKPVSAKQEGKGKENAQVRKKPCVHISPPYMNEIFMLYKLLFYFNSLELDYI